jgi:hypothetical protein
MSSIDPGGPGMLKIYYHTDGEFPDMTVSVTDDPRAEDGLQIQKTATTSKDIAREAERRMEGLYDPDDLEYPDHFHDFCEKIAEESYTPEGYGWTMVEGDAPDDILISIFYKDETVRLIEELKEQALIARRVARQFGWPFEYAVDEIYPRDYIENNIEYEEEDLEDHCRDLAKLFGDRKSPRAG